MANTMGQRGNTLPAESILWIFGDARVVQTNDQRVLTERQSYLLVISLMAVS